MIYLIAEIKASQGQESAVEKRLEDLLIPTRQEQGCHQYELYRDQEIAGLFIMQEMWSSQESLDTHLASQHLTDFRTQTEAEDLLEYLQIRPLTFIA
ncbi:MAG: putative quinol monooxygenase [Ostreibacterium sp.]